MQQGWDTSKSGEKWTVDKLRVVLSKAPTAQNALNHARAFRRNLGFVQLIYRYALTPDKLISKDQVENTFVKQIKRIAGEV